MPSSSNRDRVDEIKNRLDIVDVIRRDVELHDKGGGEYTGATSSTSKSGASLKVDQNLQIFENFATGEGGDVLDWIGYINRLDTRGADFPEVLRIGAELAGVELELEELTDEERNAAKEKADIQNLLTDATEIFYNNLKNRPELYDHIKETWGIGPETVDKYRIGYATPGRDLKDLDKKILKKSGLVYSNNGMIGGEVFLGRIIFPYWKNGKVVYLIGRETEETPEAEREKRMKYKKLLVHKEGREYVSPSVQNSYFYGEDSLRGSDYCIITEGVTDCIAMLQAGFPCISPVTVRFRKEDQPKLISLTKRLKRVYICNDNEANEKGLEGALATAEALERAGVEARLIKLPKPEDVDKIDIAEYMKTAPPEDFRGLMESSLGLCDYLLEQQEIPEGSTSRDRLRAFKAFISNPLDFMPGDEWNVFVTNEVAKKFRLKKGDIAPAVEEAERERGRRNENKTGAGEYEPQDGGRGDGEDGEKESTRYIPPLEERLKEYPKEVIRRANEILDNEDPFLYICDTFNEMHVGDRKLGEMLACSIVCTQILNAGIGIHEKPSGDAQSGKSHACLKMGELCPPWKFRATTFTPKVLYYMPDLIPGTIIYTDDIDFDGTGVKSTIKKVTADFEKPTVMDTVIDGKSVTKSIPERITIWLSSVESIGDVQLGTRFIYSNTESGTEHDHEVNHKQKGRCLGAVPKDSNEKVLICRCMLEYICDKLYNVFSAYGFVSTWNEESEKRNQEKFLDVLLAVTVFKYRQRETINGNLIGTREDWDRAVSIYSPVAQNNSYMLTDEEIVILHSIHEMCPNFEDGVPHKRLFGYMKETGRFKKSDSSLKRILLGDTKSGKQGFKEKVPGFTFEKVDTPRLDENGLEVKGAGKTRALCYTYDGDLFDGLSDGAGGADGVKKVDIVNAIKARSFVSCDYKTAEALELAFKEDPAQVYSLKDGSKKLETWKQSLRNQKTPSEIIRNHQNSKALISEESNCPIPNNNNNNSNNNLRIHEMVKKGGCEKNTFSSSSVPEPETNLEGKEKKNIFSAPLKTVNSVNSVNSEASASDHGLTSDDSVLNSEASDSDYALNSEGFECNRVLNSEAPANDQDFNPKTLLVNSEKVEVSPAISEVPPQVNSDLTGLLRLALVKFARDEYKGIVPDIDEFIRMFNKKVPEYGERLGRDAVGFNATRLRMRGWRM